MKATNVLTPVAVAIALLRQGGILDPHQYLNHKSLAMERILRVLNEKKYLSVTLFKNLEDIVPTTSLQRQRAGRSQRASLLRTFCDRVLLAWYKRHPTSEPVPTSAVLVALSVEDRLARVHTRGRPLVSDEQANQAIAQMGKYLRSENYVGGIAAGLESLERSIDKNAAWIRFLQRMIDWDVKGWLCSLIVAWCSVKIYRLCRYSMAHMAIVVQRAHIQAYRAALQQEAELEASSVPSAPPLEQEEEVEEEVAEEIVEEIVDDWETIEHGRLSPALPPSEGETKEVQEDVDEDNVCGICLESMLEVSPFEEEEREEEMFQSTRRLALGASEHKLCWYPPSRVLASLTSASRRASTWSKVYAGTIVLMTLIGGNKSKYTLLAAAVTFVGRVLTTHWEETVLNKGATSVAGEGGGEATSAAGGGAASVGGGTASAGAAVGAVRAGVSGQNCDHRFHAACLQRWARHNPTCPMCRSPLEEVSDDGQSDSGEPRPRPPPPPTTSSSPPTNSVFNVDDNVQLGTSRGKVLRRRLSEQTYDVLLEDGQLHENIHVTYLQGRGDREIPRGRYEVDYERRRARYERRRRRRNAWSAWSSLHHDMWAMEYFWMQEDVRRRQRHAQQQIFLNERMRTYDELVQRQIGGGRGRIPASSLATEATIVGEEERAAAAATAEVASMEHDQGTFTEQVRGSVEPSTTWHEDSAAWSDPPASSTTSWSQVIRQSIKKSTNSSSSGGSGWSSSSSSGGGSSGSW